MRKIGRPGPAAGPLGLTGAARFLVVIYWVAISCGTRRTSAMITSGVGRERVGTVTFDEIRAAIWSEAVTGPDPVRAETFLRKWPTASRPVLCSCSDGDSYVIKGSHNGKALVIDHVVGRLGQLMGAPVGVVTFAEIPEPLQQAEPQLQDVASGLGHATRWIPDCSDRKGIDYVNVGANRQRFALLVLLYSWVSARDQQFIYAMTPPHTVYSVDHGHFIFGGAAKWNAASFMSVPPVAIDQSFASVGLTGSQLKSALPSLTRLTSDDIRAVTRCPPDSWGVDDSDRAALSTFLIERRVQLIALVQ